MEGGGLYGLIDRETDGGRAGLKADAGKTREAPEKLQSQREEKPREAPLQLLCSGGGSHVSPFPTACMLQLL